MCNDPALPFCDTQGTLGGAVNECIAVACTPGEFAECRGDVSVVCNETRDNYELIECVRGCDDATGGCHIDPSNDLGRYLDMVQDPPDLGSPARKSGNETLVPLRGGCSGYQYGDLRGRGGSGVVTTGIVQRR